MAKTSMPRAGDSDESPSLGSDRDRLTRRERGVWRLALILLGALAIAFAAISWDQIRALPHHLEALPVGLVILVALFVAYAWGKTNEISELRGLVRGIEQQRASAGHDSDQLDQLFSLISKSQQGYRDLIDRMIGDGGEHVAEIGFRIQTVEFRGADAALDRGGAFP